MFKKMLEKFQIKPIDSQHKIVDRKSAEYSSGTKKILNFHNFNSPYYNIIYLNNLTYTLTKSGYGKQKI